MRLRADRAVVLTNYTDFDEYNKQDATKSQTHPVHSCAASLVINHGGIHLQEEIQGLLRDTEASNVFKPFTLTKSVCVALLTCETARAVSGLNETSGVLGCQACRPGIPGPTIQAGLMERIPPPFLNFFINVVNQLAPMRLYTLSKRHFVLVFVVFFVCFGLTVFIGIAGPNVIETSVARTDLNNSLKLKPFNLSSPPLSTYNQQLWLTCVVELDQHDVSFKKNVSMTVKLLGVVKDGSTPYVNNQVHSRMRLLSCAQKCSEIIVAHLGYLNYTQYNIFVSFEDLNKLTYTIQNITFTWKTYNPTFSQVEIWFRFVFVVLTFMVTCLFAHSLRKFSMRDWGIEQKWMSILLPLLLLYNDPFFPLSFLVNSWFPGMLDDLFQSLFLCALLLFWLCVYHGIRVQGERKCLTFYLPKFFIVGLLWLASVTLGIWQTVNEVQDPTYQYRVDTGNFQGMKIFFLVVATTYILYLLFLIVRACSELRNMPYVDLRLKFLTALTFVVLVISIVILYLRFGAQVLQDNFVAELSTHYQNSAEFLSFYGLLNFYLYTLAFVYSPSKNALYESQLKDNPAFSMLNDSDDDVIYGSDYEEMPLQNGQAIRAKYKEESDSD
ncbi:PREDICTED: transmembrane protein 181 [Chlamydotis macqueenii]|uniref:transmembrane protein 181 n=1 Tax=Chlamydotis macqueenii TaxID=187382 RepID=UPI0005298A32|nr:PREDICTED: transmembrane protein 181 [Chlamydotis macqueenii]